MYGLQFLLRVFPMLDEVDLITIFPDRCVYVPLLSHKQLLIVQVDPNSLVNEGLVHLTHSSTFKNGAYVKNLLIWTNWFAKNFNSQGYQCIEKAS
jgi:hypothetical protein